MSRYSTEDVIRIAEEQDVRFIRLQFTDIFGMMKNVAITIHELKKALDNQVLFDGSSIEGFVRIEESDMYLRPDPDTFAIFPWRPVEGKVARMICDVYNVDGTPFKADPRYILKRAVKNAEEMGYSMKVGTENEFFLFHTDDEGRPTLITHDNAGYFDLGPVDLGEDARREICMTLEGMDFEIETSHHEVAPGQHEIDFKYSDPLKTADNIGTFKMVVRIVAQRHGLHAAFMPKPIFGVAGSGMHIHQSLFQNGKNAFYDDKDKLGLSNIAYNYIAGLIKHAKGMTAIMNPLINSYKRLMSGYEAPNLIAWSTRNSSPFIRIPSKRGEMTRIELRNPDPSCNPYLAFAAALSAGLDGIKSDLVPPKISMNEQDTDNTDTVPGSLNEALEELNNDGVIKSALGNELVDRFIEAKKIEWRDYNMRVTPWEIEQYLNKY